MSDVPFSPAMVFVRTPYNYDRMAASLSEALRCEGVGAQQSFKEEVDINNIVRRFGVTGTLPQGVRMPVFGDFTEVGDFQSALAAVEAARESFMEMPAEVRKRFGHDPQAFVAFCSDPANADEAMKLGLVPAKPEAGPEPEAVAKTS